MHVRGYRVAVTETRHHFAGEAVREFRAPGKDSSHEESLAPFKIELGTIPENKQRRPKAPLL
jgi:hypothetical protein